MNKIGLLVLSIGKFGVKGFYQLQEVGLAKTLSKIYSEVHIYKLVSYDIPETTEVLQDFSNITLHLMPSKQFGSNGIPDMAKIDSTIQTLVCFSDTQLFFPRVYKWCLQNNIKLIPYIGAINSHSNNFLKKKLIDFLFNNNLSIYKKSKCIAKTISVANELRNKGVKNIEIAPVGLDIDLLVEKYEEEDINILKQKYGYNNNDKIILFIGRLVSEKQPERMIDVFNSLHKKDNSYKLLIIGSGELRTNIEKQIVSNNLEKNVKIIEKILNKDIWEIYRIADCLINLNQHEIYGMCILEAMYYNCKVIAWEAPGPNFIIKNGINGWLVSSDEEVLEKILNNAVFNTKDYIINNYTWMKTASIIKQITK